MSPEPGALQESGILTPRIPLDIAVRNQEERILRAMATNCAEKTFVGTTIADIVGSAGISRATFYKHFANKTECLHATIDQFVNDLQRTAGEAAAGAKGAQCDRIRAAIAAALEQLAAKPESATMLLVEAPTVDPEIVRRYRRLTLNALAVAVAADGPSNHSGADPELAFGRAQVLLTEYVAGGEVECLPSLLPELVYIALLPYVGQDSALEQAGLVA
jgi:AcrR family transcriptional regulator